MAQNTNAVKKEESAYTSPSTALNQNESLNVYAKAPTAPAAIVVKVCEAVNCSPVFTNILRAKCVTLQKRNKIVPALANALIKFTALAAVCPLSPKRIIKKRPNSTNNGAPGGWGSCNLLALAINSPVSQRLPLASRVRK